MIFLSEYKNIVNNLKPKKMRNNFASGNGHSKNPETLYTNVTEAMNETIKKQMDISSKMYNQLIGVPFSNKKTDFNNDFLAAKFFKSNSDLFEKSHFYFFIILRAEFNRQISKTGQFDVFFYKLFN